jgi:hypothetical protein
MSLSVSLQFGLVDDVALTFSVDETGHVVVEISGDNAVGVAGIRDDDLAILRGFLEAAEQYRPER